MGFLALWIDIQVYLTGFVPDLFLQWTPSYQTRVPWMILYYVHDPMCSWCWAYRPTLDSLRRRLPAGVSWQNLLGGLAPDSLEPMPDATRRMVQNHWRRIQTELGTEFNFDFWTRCQPRRSTYIACRAVLAANRQGKEEAMILAIQQAYYLRAMNPSDEEVLLELASELGMDRKQFRIDLNGKPIEAELQKQVKQSQDWPVSGFPSLVLKSSGQAIALPLDYRSAAVTLAAIPSNRY
jgi:putative protein-disulfide isomerase